MAGKLGEVVNGFATAVHDTSEMVDMEEMLQ